MKSGTRKPNILLVDDRRENLLALEKLLDEKEVNILKASSGNEALAQLLDNECAVALMDVQMPDMDGFETAALIRQNRKTQDVPIIFVTAISKAEEYVSKGYELGAVDYLFKPLQPAVVKSKVNAFLKLDRQRHELDTKATELENLNASLCQINSKLDMSLRELRLLNEDLERFASIASHDLKEPLRTVRMYLELVQKKYAGITDSEANEYIRFAVEGATRMNQLISDLLEYSRAGNRPFDVRSVDCNGVLASVLDNLKVAISQSEAKVTVGPLPTVLGDRTPLIQVFQNLISNAIKFRSSKPSEIRVSATPKENDWIISIEDNGLGIPPDEQARIFDLFHRIHARKEVDGSGIGLAVCKRIVERHGGKIWVNSEPGKGATFLFSIPQMSSSSPLRDKEST